MITKQTKLIHLTLKIVIGSKNAKGTVYTKDMLKTEIRKGLEILDVQELDYVFKWSEE